MSGPPSSARGEPWDQRLARRMVRPLAASPVTPNHITALSLAAGLAAAACYAAGGAAVHWGGLLIIASMLADHADGELARISGRTSRFGHYLDYISDGVVTVALFVGIGVGLRGARLAGGPCRSASPPGSPSRRSFCSATRYGAAAARRRSRS